MTVKIDLAPKNIKAELGDYGIFTVRPMGINEDLLLSQYAREIQEALNELEATNEKLNGKISDEESREIATRLNQITESITKDKEKVINVFKRLITCEDKKQHQRLFDEIPLNIIREKYDEVLKNG